MSKHAAKALLLATVAFVLVVTGIAAKNSGKYQSRYHSRAARITWHVVSAAGCVALFAIGCFLVLLDLLAKR